MVADLEMLFAGREVTLAFVVRTVRVFVLEFCLGEVVCLVVPDVATRTAASQPQMHTNIITMK